MALVASSFVATTTLSLTGPKVELLLMLVGGGAPILLVVTNGSVGCDEWLITGILRLGLENALMCHQISIQVFYHIDGVGQLSYDRWNVSIKGPRPVIMCMARSASEMG